MPRRGPSAPGLAALGAMLIATGALARDEDLFIRPDDQRTAIFASVDGGRSTFLSFGVKQTLVGPLDRTGFVAMETNGYGITSERYRGVVDLPAMRVTSQASTLIGYQWNLDGLFLAAYSGPELSYEQLTVDNRIYRYSEPRLGFRSQFELWAHPTPDTLLTATLVGGSSRGTAYGRSSVGYRVGGKLFVGPEVTAYTTATYREIRVGAHLTGLSLGIVQGRISGGWMEADDGRGGSPYVGVTAWIRM